MKSVNVLVTKFSYKRNYIIFRDLFRTVNYKMPVSELTT